MSPQAKDIDAREKILEAGARAIGEKSFHGCGLNEILTAAGVPKGSFYYYFASKEDFGVALVERARDEDLARLAPILDDRSRSPLERLAALYWEGRKHCIEHGPSRECLIAKLGLEHAKLSPPMREAILSAYDQLRTRLAAVIREGQDRGEIAGQLDPSRLADMLMKLWEGATMRMRIAGSIAPVDDMIDFLFRPRFLFSPSRPL